MQLGNISPGKVAIIIGENGAGKSTRLDQLSREYLSKGRDVIAIANSIHDKFRSRSKRFSLLGHRSGRKVSLKTVKRAFLNISDEDFIETKRIGQILDYVGYEPVIGFQFEFIRNIEKYALDEYDFSDEFEKQRILRLLHKIYIYTDSLDPHWIGLEDFRYKGLNISTITSLLKFEKILREIGIISEIKIFLKKDGYTIDLMEASSGELSFITSLIFISTSITDSSVILIDEPENSLHPKWQKEYITKIMDIFYYHQPTIISATHSPLVVSGAESSEGPSLDLYRADYQGLEKLTVESGNLEQILWDVFGVATPENRFFSQLIMSKLNALAENRISLMELESFLVDLMDSVYDEKQITVLRASVELAKKIEARKS